MASLDSLPPDQRAVLQLVLQRGRSYDDIAALLSIDRAAVRERALQALDALGPQTRVAADRRALITDYLLGQLPPRVADDTRERLAESASERAWARVIASELAPLASGGLPEIPSDSGAAPAEAAEPEPVAAAAQEPEAPPRAARRAAPRATARREAPRAAASREAPRIPQDYGLPAPERPDGQPRSRAGGAVLLGLGVAVVIAVIVIVIATSGSSKHHARATGASTPTTATTSASGTTGGNSARPIAQVNLKSPSGGKAIGAAIVLQAGAQQGIVLRAQGLTPNTSHDAYAVWLYNSPSDARLVGFVSPPVGKSGTLSTQGALPSNAAHFNQVLVTLEKQAKPTRPGQIVLAGSPMTGQSL